MPRKSSFGVLDSNTEKILLVLAVLALVVVVYMYMKKHKNVTVTSSQTPSLLSKITSSLSGSLTPSPTSHHV